MLKASVILEAGMSINAKMHPENLRFSLSDETTIIKGLNPLNA